MYFCVKYIDLNIYERTTERRPVDGSYSEGNEELVTTTSMVLRNRENKTLYVNPECFVAIILEYIWERVGLEDRDPAIFDFITDKGRLLNVHTYAADHNGLNVFSDKATYYLAKCDKQHQHPRPVLSKRSPEYMDYIASRRQRKSSFRKTSSTNITRAGSAGMVSITSKRGLTRRSLANHSVYSPSLSSVRVKTSQN